MKLISTIYAAIGLILTVFCLVTLGYLHQTGKVRKGIEDVLETSNVIRESERAQKLIIDMETGLRGFLLTGQKPFLEPFYEGEALFRLSINRLDSLTQRHPAQNRLVQRIRQDASRWQQEFAQPILNSRARPNLYTNNNAFYDSLFTTETHHSTGKGIMDQARERFELIKQTEERLKRDRLQELNQSLDYTNVIAIGLTLLSILVGSVLAYLLGRNIKKRVNRMNTLAQRIANGDYTGSVADHRNDEISTLAFNLNLMARKLQSSFTHLSKLNKELDQFAYVVSHDLKAPLRAINNLSEWIAEDLKTEDQEIVHNLAILRGRVQRMENLINGILTYSRIGRQSLPLSTFSSRDVVLEVLDNLAPPVSFELRVNPALPNITGERTLFYQVMANLLSNTFKYHHLPTGIVQVRARELAEEYQFEVEDDGPGISAEYQEKVFQIFQTMAARDVKESTGIGLSIVKKIVEEKGGRIWIESQKGQGTIFLFTWPKAPRDSPDNPLDLP